jgi:hypothetical protein
MGADAHVEKFGFVDAGRREGRPFLGWGWRGNTPVLSDPFPSVDGDKTGDLQTSFSLTIKRHSLIILESAGE